MKGAVRQLNLKRSSEIAEKQKSNFLLNRMKRTAGIVLLTSALSLSVFAAKPVMAEPPRKEVAELVAPHTIPKIKMREKTEALKVVEEKIAAAETIKLKTNEKEKAEISEETEKPEMTEGKKENMKTNMPKLKPYLFWRAPILGNLLYAKYIKYKKYVRIRIAVRIKEWKGQYITPVAFHASKVIPELKRHFPASTVIPKKA